MYEKIPRALSSTTYEIIEARELKDIRFVLFMESLGRVVYEDRDGNRYYMKYGQLIEAKTVDEDGCETGNTFVPASTRKHSKKTTNKTRR